MLDPLSGCAAEGRRGVLLEGPPASAGRVRAEAERFRLRHAALLGAEGAELQCVRDAFLGRAWHVTWQQAILGVPIDGAILDCVLSTSGSVVAFRSRLVPAPPAAIPAAKTDRAAAACGLVLGRAVRIESMQPAWVPIATPSGWECVPASRCAVADDAGGRWEALMDVRSDRIVSMESRIRHAAVVGSATASVQPRFVFDAPEDRPLAWLEVGLEAPVRGVFAAEDGRFVFEDLVPGPVRITAGLRGRFVAVRNEAGDPVASRQVDAIAPGEAAVYFGTVGSRADERTIYYHATRIHDWAKQRFGFESLDFPLPATAAVRHPMSGGPDYANAFYDGQGIHFGNGGMLTYELGLFADVIYHEYTHGITDRMYRPGGGLPTLEGGAIHEGLSDYFACTLTDEPLMGEHLFRDNLQPYLRNLENTRQWPEDRGYQVHSDGEILAGALWDIRRLVGADIADPLVHFARATFPRTFEQYARAVLLQDDLQFGDGAAANGSPHRDAIVAAFAAHGLGPAANISRAIAHQPLADTETAEVARLVDAGFVNALSAPSDSLWLSYSNGGGFETRPMQRRPDGRFEAEIPSDVLVDGARIRYYLRAAGTRSRPQLFDPTTAPDSTYGFKVGEDREPPVILTTLRSSAAAFTWPAKLVARVSDNLGIASAAVEVRQGDDSFWLGLLPIATTSPEWRMAQFPNVGALGDVFEYRIVAVDASRAANTTHLPAVGWQRIELVEELEDDFEGGAWWSHASLVLDHADPWHLSADFDHTPGGSWAWRAGSDTEEYPAGISAELITDEFEIGVGARASVWSWIDVEPNGLSQAFDGCFIQAAPADQATWTTLIPTSGYTHVVAAGGGSHLLRPGDHCLSGRARTWVPLGFDLSSFAQQRIRLRFVFESDPVASPFRLRGWALDDFRIEPGSQLPSDAEVADTGSHALLTGPPGPSPSRGPIQFNVRVQPATPVVQLDLFDVRGRLVHTATHEQPVAGLQVLVWDGRLGRGLAAPAGVYYYRLASRWGIERGSVTLVR